MKLFGLDASAAGARNLAQHLGLELSRHEEREFADGEFKVRPLESVVAEDVFVYQSLAGGGSQSVSDKLVRLLILIGALKDSGAARVTAIVPYLAFARKDRRTKSRDPISIRYVAQMFEAVGVDAIVAADVHNVAAFENAFRCRTILLDTVPLFVERFLPVAEEARRIVVVSPDSGGVKRARAFASLLAERSARETDLAFMDKHRSEGRVSGELFAGDVRDASVIVIDDLISGGTTMVRAAAACRSRGARAVHAAATHAVFEAGTEQNLATVDFESITVSDTTGVEGLRGTNLGSKLDVLPTGELFARAVRRGESER